MKWIKREEAIESIAKRMLTKEQLYDSGDAKECAKYMLKDTSPIEIIQCKDCEYWQDNNWGYPNPNCRWKEQETPDADDFCSFAERREL